MSTICPFALKEPFSFIHISGSGLSRVYPLQPAIPDNFVTPMRLQPRERRSSSPKSGAGGKDEKSKWAMEIRRRYPNYSNSSYSIYQAASNMDLWGSPHLRLQSCCSQPVSANMAFLAGINTSLQMPSWRQVSVSYIEMILKETTKTEH